MAKRKLWAMRDDRNCGEYILASSAKRPYKRNGRWLALGDWSQTMGFLPFEHIFHFELQDGGGPVEIRFADEA